MILGATKQPQEPVEPDAGQQVLGSQAPAGRRQITDQAGFTSAVGRLQNYVKEQYGYTMPFDQASGLVLGDPAASNKIDVSLPTMAFQDQDFKQRVLQSGLTGLWEGQPTLEARKVALGESELAEKKREYDLTYYQEADQFARRLGLDREVFLEGVRRYNQGRTDDFEKWSAEYGLTVKNFEQRVLEFNATFSEGVRRFDLTYEQQADQFAKRLGLDRDVFMEGVREFNAGREDQLAQFAQTHKLNLDELQERIREFNASSAETQRQFNITIEQRRKEHAENLRLNTRQFDEAVRQFNAGRMDQLAQFAQTYGLTLKELEENIRQFNVNNALDERRLDEDTRRFNLTLDQRKEEHAATLKLSTRQFDESVRQFNLSYEQGNAQFAANLKISERDFAEAVRQYDLGRTDQLDQFAQTHGLNREQLTEQIRQFNIARTDRLEQFAQTMGLSYEQLAESVRQYNLSREDQISQFARTFGLDERELNERIRQFDANVELENKRLSQQFDLENLAQRNRLELAELEDTFREEAEDRAYLRQLVFRDIDITEAEKDRIWRSTEAELDRKFRSIVTSDDRSWQERQAELQRSHENWGALFEGLGTVGGEALIRRWFGDTGTRTVGMTPLQMTADMLMGKNTTASWYKTADPSLTDEQANALATRAAAQKGVAAETITVNEGAAAGGGGDEVLGDGGAAATGAESAAGAGGAGAAVAGEGAAGAAAGGDASGIEVVIGEPTGGELVTTDWGQVALPGEYKASDVMSNTTLAEDAGPLGGSKAGDVRIQMKDGKTFEYRPGRGGWHQLSSIGTDTPPSWGQLYEDMKGLSARDLMTLALYGAAGFGTAGQLRGTSNRLVQGMSLLAGFGTAAATAGPLGIGAYAAGIIAEGIYHSFNVKDPGVERRYEWAAPVDQRPPGVSTATPGEIVAVFDWHADPTKTYDAAGGSLFDPNKSEPGVVPGAVYWVNQRTGQTVAQETIAQYAERTGRTPLSFFGGEDEMYGAMPEELRRRFAEARFKPTFVFKNEDGSITFINRNQSRSILLEAADATRIFGGSFQADGEGDEGDSRGQAPESVLLEEADTASPLDRSQIELISGRIDDQGRRNRFLRKLANSEPFADEDIDYIFGRQQGGGYRYASAWDVFNRFVTDGTISTREKVLGED